MALWADQPLIPWSSTALQPNAPADTNVSTYWETNKIWGLDASLFNLSTRSSGRAARQLQLTLRLTWQPSHGDK
jgi:hypothetical protein